ncbi:site-2 protease family protein [Leifsonia sp. P73]|uniref:site-2 protease family protein n=1 Tax=Leifsonia sp. P73 TaxID=3423959 RepID=UPI003DA2ADF1
MDLTLESWPSLPELKLRADTQILTAADGRPLLKAPNGRFVVVSGSSSVLLSLLQDGLSGAELAEATGVIGSATQGDRGVALVGAFLGVLDRAGMLTVSDATGQPITGLFAGIGVDFLKRIPLRGLHADHVFDPIGRRLKILPPSVLTAVLLTVFIGSAVSVPVLLRGQNMSADLWAILIAAVFVLLFLPLHESCHATAMRYWGIHIREVGVGLLAFIAPVAYVDRTETYALRSRWGRLTIAIIGPACDAAVALVFAIAAVTIPDVSSIFGVASAMQFGVMIMNLNPLVRGDGYHAIEAAFGRLNVRAHAFEYVASVLMRRSQPVHLANQSRRVRLGYVVYVAFGLVYMLGAVCVLVFVLVSMAGAMQ